jgi:MGT family glycosyltransferase
MLDPRPRRKFIVTTWEGGGSVGPALTVARKLVDAGHDVRVMSDECNRPEGQATGARFASWTRAPSRTDRHRQSELLRDWEAKSPGEAMAQVMSSIFAGRAAHYAADVVEELAREPADLVIGSELIMGVELGCEVARQPCAVLACNSVFFPIAGAPQAGPPMSAEQIEAMAPIMTQFTKAFDRGTEVLNRARADFGLPPLESMFDQVLVARKTLIAVSRTFDFGPQTDSRHFTYVGPQLDETGWAEQWQSPWSADDPRPLVLVGFSTTFQNHGAILQRVIDALGKLAVRALVTLGPAILPEELDPPENVELVASAPHNAVMCEADLVVTHGGHGTVARAMVHKLPMLVIPHGRDQDGNAARIVAHGAGLMLPPSAGTGEIHAALSRLLDDPGYREAAALLGEKVGREMSECDIVAELEGLCQALPV